MKKIIILVVVLAVLAGVMKTFGLDEYLSVYTADETADVTVVVEDSQETNEVSESYKRLIKYIVTEKADFSSTEKPEKFDKDDYLKDIRYDITIDGKEYVYKPAIDVVAKTEFGKTTYATLESTDKVLMNFVVSD